MFMGPRVAVWVEPVEVVQWNAHVDRIRGYTHGLTRSILWEVGLQRCDLRAIDWAGGPPEFCISAYVQDKHARPESLLAAPFRLRNEPP